MKRTKSFVERQKSFLWKKKLRKGPPIHFPSFRPKINRGRGKSIVKQYINDRKKSSPWRVLDFNDDLVSMDHSIIEPYLKPAQAPEIPVPTTIAS